MLPGRQIDIIAGQKCSTLCVCGTAVRKLERIAIFQIVAASLDAGALDSFRGTHGQPVHPRHMLHTLPGRPNTRPRQDVARLQYQLSPRDVNDPFLAVFNKPSTERSTRTRYFCEACAVPVLACDLDWQMHLNGAGHQRQILSLRENGELGHRPQGEL